MSLTSLMSHVSLTSHVNTTHVVHDAQIIPVIYMSRLSLTSHTAHSLSVSERLLIFCPLLQQKYITEFQREKEEFEKNMTRFKEEHPELIEERKKSDLPEKPKTPQQLWYNHEKKTYMKLHPEVSQKELKEALRRQWSQLSDKRRLKWISKALELQKDYEGSMRAYHEAHPDVNSDDHVRSVLTKAERQLKDKFDGRPTKPPPNGYSLYCAELMVNMKDVPSTERMVLCSKQWKMMTQKEKDMFQKRCEQRKKQYDIDLQRFLESLPEEERDRVLGEEKLGGARVGGGVAASPHRAKSPSVKERCREAEPETWTPAGAPRERRDGKKAAKLPETPKTAEETWQQSVMGDFLSKYRVSPPTFFFSILMSVI
ncbi:nucleolar transcription factor 1-B-like isoform X2 [Plectropomus leopardus]|uniref:nucleolar transcription factor 1-B-like isoform X2 n=1 Tax=Plectropomus leopardus TaxID=160734 RepID=UPI001C4C6771|nr:nucleolar transcription factor 1-B-like isoform X2 [Plectropomus leopardus]